MRKKMPCIWLVLSMVFGLMLSLSPVQAGADTVSPDCATKKPTWDDYSDAGHTAQPPNDTYNSAIHVAYFYGKHYNNIPHDGHDQYYNIGIYDHYQNWMHRGNLVGAIFRVRAKKTGDGELGSGESSEYPLVVYDFTSNKTAVWGANWHSAVTKASNQLPTEFSLMPELRYVAYCDFNVDQDAIPEFPAVPAAVAVAGLCAVIYWWLRKKRCAALAG